jgi:primase-polymerase (primpol)-like protein
MRPKLRSAVVTGPGSCGACHRARIRATRWLGRDDTENGSDDYAVTALANSAKSSSSGSSSIGFTAESGLVESVIGLRLP